MDYFELEQDAAIKAFLEATKSPSKKDLFNLYYNHFLHPDHYTEHTNKVCKNAIDITYDYFLNLSKRKRFHFLRALGKLFDVALSMKSWEWMLSRNDAAGFWGKMPTYFLSLTSLTESLESIRRDMGEVDRKCLYQKVICVEGESEHEFIKTIYLTTRAANFDSPIYCYGGKGELRNLLRFIQEKNRQGIRVFLSFDNDGDSNAKIFISKIKKKCNVHKVFGFPRDFESSFSSEMLAIALNYYLTKFSRKKLKKVTIKDVNRLLRQVKPFIRSFEHEWEIAISKPKLGKILGGLTADIIKKEWNDIFNRKRKKKKHKAAIFRFMKFLMQ